jgi:hypothetical protein
LIQFEFNVIVSNFVLLTIGNVWMLPTRIASEFATCGLSQCNSNNQANFIPSYLVVNDPTPNGSLKDPRTNTDIVDSSRRPISNPLKEGEIATLQIPAIATANTYRESSEDGLQSQTPQIIYSITNQNPLICPFLKPGRIKLEPVVCQRSRSATPDCLLLYLNYNSQTGQQDPLPMNTPVSCNFTLTAHDSLYPASKTSLGNYKIYIQDVNLAPSLLSAAPCRT